MPEQDWLILIGIGAFFILLGLGGIIWGKSEEKGYYDSLTTRPDSREFLNHWPKRPQFGALKTGGWIAIAIGVVMAVMGGAFLLWG